MEKPSNETSLKLVALIKAEEKTPCLVFNGCFWGVAVVVPLGHQRAGARRLGMKDGILGRENPGWYSWFRR